MAVPFAFYDLDGTLVSSDVVTQYLWYARNHPGAGMAWRYARALVRAPRWIGLELTSRRRFNEVFFREYAGLRLDWMSANAPRLYEEVLGPAAFPGARDLVAGDLAEGFRPVLLTGSLDFAIAPLSAHFGFGETIANRLEFHDGIATGSLIEPVLSGPEKVDAIRALCERDGVDPNACRAYSDSMSDVPMLEAVGHPRATNPVKKLRALAAARGWPMVDLR
ncbi:MAG: HAD family phosphatase [Bryobacterales bacterium]|nr:HAD family phosphatase [Bryobacterales bacterium]